MNANLCVEQTLDYLAGEVGGHWVETGDSLRKSFCLIRMDLHLSPHGLDGE
jgi:hypothetical protein